MTHLTLLHAWVLATAKRAGARLRGDDRDDAGLTMVEYLLALVIAVPAIIIIVTLIYNWLQNKAETVTSQ